MSLQTLLDTPPAELPAAIDAHCYERATADEKYRDRDAYLVAAADIEHLIRAYQASQRMENTK